MTLERAYYHKLMLEVGLAESFDQELDEMLEQEDPLSELTLALSTCGGDRNEQIHILNDYILSVPKEQIDKDAVFSLVAEDFRTRYEQSPETLEQLTRQMGSAAWLSGWWTEDPWNAMYLMSDWYDDIEARLLPRERVSTPWMRSAESYSRTRFPRGSGPSFSTGEGGRSTVSPEKVLPLPVPTRFFSPVGSGGVRPGLSFSTAKPKAPSKRSWITRSNIGCPIP